MSPYVVPNLAERLAERGEQIEYLHRAGFTAYRIAQTLNLPIRNVRARIYRLEAQR